MEQMEQPEALVLLDSLAALDPPDRRGQLDPLVQLGQLDQQACRALLVRNLIETIFCLEPYW